MTKGFKAVLILLTAAFITSCGTKHKGYTKHENGTYSKFHIQDETAQAPEIGDVITLDVIYGTKDSTIFNSALMQMPFQQEYNGPLFDGDIYSCISMMKLGDSASFVINADSFYLKTAKMPNVPKFFQKDKDLFIDLKLRKIMTREEALEEQQNEIQAFKDLEQRKIESYLKRKNTQLNEDGYTLEITQRGDGKKFKKGQMILIHYELNVLNGALIYSSRNNKKTIDFEFGTNFETKGFQMVMQKLSKGAKAEFMIPSSLAFGEMGTRGKITPYCPLRYKVEIIDVIDKADYKEMKRKEADAIKNAEIVAITKYINENDFPAEPVTKSGLYYQQTEKGSGAKVKTGDKVLVHYTLYLLDGSKVDSSHDRGEPLEFIVDKSSMIQGWHEGIKLMNVGEKGKLLVPSKLGYGERQRSEQLKPYTPLLFELEVVEIIAE